MKEYIQSVAENQAYDAMVRDDFSEALRLLLPLAEAESEYALISLGRLYETKSLGAPDLSKAGHYYERAANGGSQWARFCLGDVLHAQKHRERARAAYQIGADEGYPPSMKGLGKMLVNGEGGAENVTLGIDLLQKAADQGQIFAQRALLSIQHKNARSIIERIYIKLKIVKFVVLNAFSYAKDPSNSRFY